KPVFKVDRARQQIEFSQSPPNTKGRRFRTAPFFVCGPIVICPTKSKKSKLTRHNIVNQTISGPSDKWACLSSGPVIVRTKASLNAFIALDTCTGIAFVPLRVWGKGLG